jgi:hypothetical protein
MIPTLMAFGLLAGRWPWIALLIGTVGWPVWLIVDGIVGSATVALTAAALAAVNTGVGVLVHQAIVRVARR